MKCMACIAQRKFLLVDRAFLAGILVGMAAVEREKAGHGDRNEIVGFREFCAFHKDMFQTEFGKIHGALVDTFGPR